MARKLDNLMEQDFLLIEEQLVNLRTRRESYVCERQRRLNRDAMRKVKEYIHNYLNSKYYAVQRHD